MVDVLVWRLAAADRAGVPFLDGERRRAVVIGASSELPGGGCVWFRVLSPAADGSRVGDRLSPEMVVAEVRDESRARSRCEQVTGMYRAKGWAVVVPPRVIDMPDPPVSPDEVMLGFPLQTWAEAVTQRLNEDTGRRV
jgi:hypothetical protein